MKATCIVCVLSALALACALAIILRSTVRAAETSDPAKIFEERSLVYTGGAYKEHPFKYRLLVPAGCDRRAAPSESSSGAQATRTWPLILFLHGAGERGNDNQAQLKYFPTDMASSESRAKYPCFFLAPQCPKDRAWSARNIPELLQGASPEPPDELKAVLRMLEETMKEFPVDPQRIYLTGLSMGGFGSWYLAALHPERWAAVVPICGGGDPKKAPLIKDLPIWAFHGARDPVVQPQKSREMVEALQKAGGSPLYTEFPEAGHDSWTPGYRHPDFLPWLFAQRIGGPGQALASAREWFEDAKFGLFVHWGVYSVLGRGEWVMNNEKIPISEYEKLPPKFNPTDFDPAEWVGIVKRAGQKYITITSKHHDGFCMWGTKQTKYNIVDGAPYGRDVLQMLSDECKKQGIKLFFYHSHLDWHHPDYFPRGGTGQASGRPESGEWSRYMDYLNAQIAELCSPPYEAAGIWFDGWWDRPQADWQLAKTYGIIHRLRPAALVGNNHHVAPFPGEDFQMFEQDLPGMNSAGFNTAEVSRLPLETCRTMNNSWGYNAQDKGYRPLPQQIRFLVEAVGRGANLLLNVGPMPNGKFPPEAAETLLGIGRWLEKNGEAVYGTRPGPWFGSKAGYAVRKGKRAYFHLLEWPASGKLVLPAIAGLWKASVLGGPEIEAGKEGETVAVALPESVKDTTDTILAFDFDRDLAGTAVDVPPSRVRVEGEKTVLGAGEARATGKIRLEGPPKSALGYWVDPGDTVTWSVDSPEASELDVSIAYACAKGSGGSQFEVACGDSRVSGEVLETEDWASFVTVPLGLISVPKGPSEIVVRVSSKPQGVQGVMNLRQLELEKGFVSLFDGKSLGGWYQSKDSSGKRPPAQGYEARDGAIVCVPGPGGNIYTEKEYSDFCFRFEFIVPPGGNNGIGVRAPDGCDAAYCGFEIQILDDPGYKGQIADWQHHGSIYGVVAAKSGHLRPAGEWNTEEIRWNGRRITVTLNGVTIVDADIDEARAKLSSGTDEEKARVKAHEQGFKQEKGYICFCGHGAAVQFRDLRVKELAGK